MSRNRALMNENRAHWDEAASIHPKTEFYDVPGFKRDKRPFDDLALLTADHDDPSTTLVTVVTHRYGKLEQPLV